MMHFLQLMQLEQRNWFPVFDYNRKDKDGKSRELHTSQAIDAINFADVQDDFRTEYEQVQNEPVEMVASPYFTTSTQLISMKSGKKSIVSILNWILLLFLFVWRVLAVLLIMRRMKFPYKRAKQSCCQLQPKK